MPIEVIHEEHEQAPKKVYLAGPMSGLPDFNYPAFYEAAEVLRAKGFDVKNPADTPEQNTWQDYMRHAIAMLVQCEAVYLLPGWGRSKGAFIEFMLATNLGIETVLPEKWCPEIENPWEQAGVLA